MVGIRSMHKIFLSVHFCNVWVAISVSERCLLPKGLLSAFLAGATACTSTWVCRWAFVAVRIIWFILILFQFIIFWRLLSFFDETAWSIWCSILFLSWWQLFVEASICGTFWDFLIWVIETWLCSGGVVQSVWSMLIESRFLVESHFMLFSEFISSIIWLIFIFNLRLACSNDLSTVSFLLLLVSKPNLCGSVYSLLVWCAWSYDVRVSSTLSLNLLHFWLDLLGLLGMVTGICTATSDKLRFLLYDCRFSHLQFSNNLNYSCPLILK